MSSSVNFLYSSNASSSYAFPCLVATVFTIFGKKDLLFFPNLILNMYKQNNRLNLQYHVINFIKNLLHSLGLVYKSMRGMVTNSIDRDQWLNVTSESRDRI
jgi:hypothetical protein